MQEHVDLWGDVNEIFAPEIVFWIAQQFDERDDRTPWVRAVNEETLQENPGHDLAETVVVDLQEQMHEEAAEPVSMRVGVAKVKHDSAEHMVLT